MKRAVVCGAGGLIGAHLMRRLKRDGSFVRGLGRSAWDEARHRTQPSDEYWVCDLRQPQKQFFENVDEVYQLACEVGGLGYIADPTHDADCLRNSTLIDINVLEACRINKVPKVFFASSACVYPAGSKQAFAETDAYPANPSNEFAAQKLFAERLYGAYGRNYDIDVRIGRLFNCYGVGMAWTGGREKVVAALCRKIAEMPVGKPLSVWGDGSQRRSFLHVDDAVDGIVRLMRSDYAQPLNIGTNQCVTIKMLLAALAQISGKTHTALFDKRQPSGVSSICCDTTRCEQVLGWVPQIGIAEGLETVYPWVASQVLTAAKS